MSFNEKLHWAAFVALISAFGWYFLSYPWQIVGTRAGVAAAAAMLLPVTIIIIAAMTITAAFLPFGHRRKRI